MDPEQQDVAEAATRPHREQHLPQRLSDYELGYLPQTRDPPPKAPSHASERRAGETGSPSPMSEHSHRSHTSGQQVGELKPPSVRSTHTQSKSSHHSANIVNLLTIRPPPLVRVHTVSPHTIQSPSRLQAQALIDPMLVQTLDVL